MDKAINVRTGKVKGVWFAFADIVALEYQERFRKKPTRAQVDSACMSFEFNYSNLSDTHREPQTGKARKDKV